MTKQEARQELEAIQVGLQKTRSVMAEIGLPEETLAQLYPWIWGDRCPIPLITRLLDGDFTTMEWFNIRTIFYHFMDAALAETMLYYHGATGKPFPTDPPDLQVVAGWEEEPCRPD